MQRNDVLILQNDAALLSVDLTGGAITSFRFKEEDVNPLNFCMKQETVDGAHYNFQGHFLCLGQWGDRSAGEEKAGLVKHGDFVRIAWDAATAGNGADMKATSVQEGMTIERTIAMDAERACFHVTETVTNAHTLGRMYHIVQHPTIAAPFLDEHTIVDCNALYGFDYAFEQYSNDTISEWPDVKTKPGTLINLSSPETAYSSVFSFVIPPDEEWGWVTAYSPGLNMLLGYCWRRNDYPWINLWLHYSEEKLQYRGLEFGNTGVHKPFKEIIEKDLLRLLGERTYSFLDAGAEETRKYSCFLKKMLPGFKGVEFIRWEGKELIVSEKETGKIHSII